MDRNRVETKVKGNQENVFSPGTNKRSEQRKYQQQWGLGGAGPVRGVGEQN